MLPDRHPHLPPHNAEGLALGRLGGDAGQFFGTSGREGEDFRGDLAASGDFGEGPSDVTLGLPKPATNILSLFSISSSTRMTTLPWGWQFPFARRWSTCLQSNP